MLNTLPKQVRLPCCSCILSTGSCALRVSCTNNQERDGSALEGSQSPFPSHRTGPAQAVDSYEFELASDFEDEEIDEEAAFTEEDKKLYAGMFGSSDADAAAGEAGGEPDLLVSDEDDDAAEVLLPRQRPSTVPVRA